MRELTAKQKKMLDEWIASKRTENAIENPEVYKIVHENASYVVDGKPAWRLRVADMDMDTWDRIQEIHPTEIHYSNVENYLENNS